MTSPDNPRFDKHRLSIRATIVRDGAILLVEFNDETGLHYNLPGGGVEPGESIHQALHREVREEAAAEIVTLYPRCQELILRTLHDEYPRPLFTTDI